MAERVLLVEDEPINQRVGAAMLQHLGFSVDVVADGGAAVEAASRTTYRAILMDCQLPVLEGFEAIAAIRRAEDAAHRTPIFSLTASDPDVERRRCLAAGADAFLTKPLRADELVLVLDSCVRNIEDGPPSMIGRANTSLPDAEVETNKGRRDPRARRMASVR